LFFDRLANFYMKSTVLALPPDKFSPTLWTSVQIPAAPPISLNDQPAFIHQSQADQPFLIIALTAAKAGSLRQLSFSVHC